MPDTVLIPALLKCLLVLFFAKRNQGGYVTIPTDNAWHVLTLPLSAFAMTGAASPYTDFKFSFRIHSEGYADARYEQSSYGNQGYTYILACRPA